MLCAIGSVSRIQSTHGVKSEKVYCYTQGMVISRDALVQFLLVRGASRSGTTYPKYRHIEDCYMESCHILSCSSGLCFHLTGFTNGY